MDERERDYWQQHIQELERSKRRWKLATFTLAAALAILLVVGSISSFLFGVVEVRRQREDALMEQMERARAAEEAARLQNKPVTKEAGPRN